MLLLWLIIHYHKKLRIPFRNSLDVTYTLNHYWMKYIILVVNLSFFFFHKRIYMKKNERFSDMALKKEIWFQHYAMVINVHKLLWFFDTWKEICLTISKKKGYLIFLFSSLYNFLDFNQSHYYDFHAVIDKSVLC